MNSKIPHSLCCCVCLDIYQNPLMFLCAHSICTRCACLLVDQSKNHRILCPLCRQETHVNELIPNQILSSQVSHFIARTGLKVDMQYSEQDLRRFKLYPSKLLSSMRNNIIIARFMNQSYYMLVAMFWIFVLFASSVYDIFDEIANAMPLMFEILRTLVSIFLLCLVLFFSAFLYLLFSYLFCLCYVVVTEYSLCCRTYFRTYHRHTNTI